MHWAQHNLTRWITIIALLAVMVWPSFGQVLCVDDSGHFAIEAPHAADGCAKGNALYATQDHESSPVVSPRGCYDFTLMAPPGVRPQRDLACDLLADPAFSPVLFVLDVDPPVVVRCDNADRFKDCPARTQQLRVVSATVLLI